MSAQVWRDIGAALSGKGAVSVPRSFGMISGYSRGAILACAQSCIPHMPSPHARTHTVTNRPQCIRASVYQCIDLGRRADRNKGSTVDCRRQAVHALYRKVNTFDKSKEAREQGLKDRPKTRSPRASRLASTAAGLSEARGSDDRGSDTTQHVLTATTSDSEARPVSPSFESWFPCQRQHGNARNQAKRPKNCVAHSTRLSSGVHLLAGKENAHLEGVQQPLWNRKPVIPLPLVLFITHGLFWHRPTILMPRAIVLRHWLGHKVVGAGIGVVFGLLKV